MGDYFINLIENSVELKYGLRECDPDVFHAVMHDALAQESEFSESATIEGLKQSSITCFGITFTPKSN